MLHRSVLPCFGLITNSLFVTWIAFSDAQNLYTPAAPISYQILTDINSFGILNNVTGSQIFSGSPQNTTSSSLHPSPPACDRFGFYGNHCEHECHCAYGPGACGQGGFCDGNCSEGWTGSHCQHPCPIGQYGLNCMFNCSENCLNQTCGFDDGFCFCEEDAPEIDCEPGPGNIDAFLTRLWLIVCLATLLMVAVVIVCGFQCARRARKRNFIKLTISRSGELHTIDLTGRRSLLRTSGPRKSAAYLTKNQLSRKSSQRTSFTLPQIQTTAAPGTESPKARAGTKSPPKIQPAVLAKHIQAAMPNYKVQVNAEGNLTLVKKRKPGGLAFRRESMVRIMRQRAHQAQENVRKGTSTTTTSGGAVTATKNKLDVNSGKKTVGRKTSTKSNSSGASARA